MKSLTLYALEVLACSGVLLAAYSILLERKVKFRWCRLYLLLSTAAAALIPLLRIPVWPGQVIVATPSITTPDLADWTAEVLPDAAGQPAVSPAHFCLAVYLLGAALILGVMVWQMIRIRLLRRDAVIARAGRWEIVRTRQEIASFSFFRTIYVWDRTPAGELDAIIAHESSHIAHRHSVERILMECMKAVLWWNPFAWIAARRLTEVEEYEADSDVLDSGYDRAEYMQTIFKQLFGYTPRIANGLRNSLTKKRFTMMTTQTKQRHALLRLAGTLPVLIGLLCVFSFTSRAAIIVAPATGVATRTETDTTATVPATGITWEQASPTATDAGKDKACRVRVSVKDENKQPVKGAAVCVVGTTDGTVTDAAGDAEITVAGGSKLIISYPGYEAQIIETTAGTEVRSVMLLKPAGKDPTAKVGGTATDTNVRMIVTRGGKPLSGALVTVKGTTRGTVTDASGYAALNVRPESLLEVSYFGCETQELRVDNWPQKTFTVELKPQPGKRMSLTGGGKPLWIVDGKESTPELINEIDPAGIATMMVSKDPGAVAKYGERARNGVIIITTTGFAAAQEKNQADVPGTDGNATPSPAATSPAAVTPDSKSGNSKTDDEPFLVSEVMPSFQGGNVQQFRSWVQENLKYPKTALDNNIHGRVVLSFIIERDGSVGGIKILQSPDRSLSEEARRVIASSPRWKPGEQGGKKVRVQYTFPVDFRMTVTKLANIRDDAVRQTDDTEAEHPFILAETMPMFPMQEGDSPAYGDVSSFRKWVQEQIVYPAEALKKGIEGRVVLSFVVEKDGSVSTIETKQTPDESLAEEARRVASNSPRWKPGEQQGKIVRVRYLLPVDFKITRYQENLTADKDDPFTVVDTPPQFNGGGLEVFRKWMQEHVRYPEDALGKNICGRVLFKFVVEKDGSISDVEVFKSPDKSLTDEVCRVIAKAPKWTPGKQRGEAVRVRFGLPIDFTISTDAQGGMLRDKADTPKDEFDGIVVVGFGTQKK